MTWLKYLFHFILIAIIFNGCWYVRKEGKLYWYEYNYNLGKKTYEPKPNAIPHKVWDEDLDKYVFRKPDGTYSEDETESAAFLNKSSASGDDGGGGGGH